MEDREAYNERNSIAEDVSLLAEETKLEAIYETCLLDIPKLEVGFVLKKINEEKGEEEIIYEDENWRDDNVYVLNHPCSVRKNWKFKRRRYNIQGFYSSLLCRRLIVGDTFL
jgi:hypothetical protein